MTDIILNNNCSTARTKETEGKEMIKIYPYCVIQDHNSGNSGYRIARLNVVKKEFEVLKDFYEELDVCNEEVKVLNEESGPVEYFLEDEV